MFKSYWGNLQLRQVVSLGPLTHSIAYWFAMVHKNVVVAGCGGKMHVLSGLFGALDFTFIFRVQRL